MPLRARSAATSSCLDRKPMGSDGCKAVQSNGVLASSLSLFSVPAASCRLHRGGGEVAASACPERSRPPRRRSPCSLPPPSLRCAASRGSPLAAAASPSAAGAAVAPRPTGRGSGRGPSSRSAIPGVSGAIAPPIPQDPWPPSLKLLVLRLSLIRGRVLTGSLGAGPPLPWLAARGSLPPCRGRTQGGASASSAGSGPYSRLRPRSWRDP